jgi:5-formyltetrahydrofolate cyclo-ligase
MKDPSSEKNMRRTQFRELLAGISERERHVRSLAAGTLLVQTAEFMHAQVIMVYLNMPQEVDTSPIILRAWQEGKQVVAPKLAWNDHTMLPVEITTLTTHTQTGPAGIREPRSGQLIPIDCIDLMIVPGLAFGTHGQRLGRGGGFYDRFLAQPKFHGISCGLAFEPQVAEDLPLQPHDVILNLLVTDSTIRRFRTEACDNVRKVDLPQFQ